MKAESRAASSTGVVGVKLCNDEARPGTFARTADVERSDTDPTPDRRAGLQCSRAQLTDSWLRVSRGRHAGTPAEVVQHINCSVMRSLSSSILGRAWLARIATASSTVRAP